MFAYLIESGDRMESMKYLDEPRSGTDDPSVQRHRRPIELHGRRTPDSDGIPADDRSCPRHHEVKVGSNLVGVEAEWTRTDEVDSGEHAQTDGDVLPCMYMYLELDIDRIGPIFDGVRSELNRIRCEHTTPNEPTRNRSTDRASFAAMAHACSCTYSRTRTVKLDFVESSPS